MTEKEIDEFAAAKASLELTIADNNEIHEYFRDLLEKLSRLEDAEPDMRREKFRELVEMGAFRFNGLDMRHFTHSQQRPLPPPVLLNRTRRRLKNTAMLLNEFEKRGMFEQAGKLLAQIDTLAAHIINGTDAGEVIAYKDKLETLRASPLFQQYMETKTASIHKDGDIKADADFLAAKESVQEGEEVVLQRSEELSELGEQLENGELAAEEAQNKLEELRMELYGAPGKGD